MAADQDIGTKRNQMLDRIEQFLTQIEKIAVAGRAVRIEPDIAALRARLGQRGEKAATACRC